MGKLVNGKFLRLGFRNSWVGSQDLCVGWNGGRVFRDVLFVDYVRGLLRDMMRKDEVSFRSWGVWFSRCEFYLVDSEVRFGVYVYEGEIDNFCGKVFYEEEYDLVNEVKVVEDLRKKVYGYMKRMIELDFEFMFGVKVEVVIFTMESREITSMVLGEVVVRRVYDGEKLFDVLKDLRKSFGLDQMKVEKRIKKGKFSRSLLTRRNRFLLMGAFRKKKVNKQKYTRLTTMRVRYDFMMNARDALFRRKRMEKGSFRLEGMKGFKVSGNGMFVRRHKSMSQSIGITSGYVALSSVKENIDYEEMHVNLRTSKCGIKVWVNKVNSEIRARFRQSISK